MDIGSIFPIISQAIMIVLIIACILIIPSFIVSLIISIFQATTQIQEQTMTFIPKLTITLVIAMLLGPSIVKYISDFFLAILQKI